MFEAGHVTYSNASKISELHVSEDVVATFGSVSVATPRGPWPGAPWRRPTRTSPWQLPVSPDRVAGPLQKPVGTVVFAVAERNADPAKIVADQKFFDEKTRSGVRLQAALCALDLLLP